MFITGICFCLVLMLGSGSGYVCVKLVGLYVNKDVELCCLCALYYTDHIISVVLFKLHLNA